MATILPPRQLGEPVDRLLAAYALVAGAALFFPYRPAAWPLLAAAHVIAILALAGTAPFARVWESALARWPRTLTAAGDAYPIALIPFLYAELPWLNRSVWNGRYFDDVILRVEERVFGMQPSLEWARAMPVPALSELLHGAYLSYYFIVFVPPLLIWWKAGTPSFRQAVFALLLTFVTHYVFFIWFPVQGPRYLFPAPGGAIAGGGVYRFTHWILEAGSSQGAAFPSSHVGVAVAQTLLIYRYLRPLWPVMAVLAVGLAAGAIYGGFHYATDAFFGAALGALAAAAAPSLYRRGSL